MVWYYVEETAACHQQIEKNQRAFQESKFYFGFMAFIHIIHLFIFIFYDY